jgi:cell division protein FtsB
LEFSFDRQQNTQDNSDTSGIANERLRKAIERNRQRQKEREQREQTQTDRPQAARPQFVRPQFQSPPPPPPPFEQQINQAAAQENIAEEVQAEEVEVEEVIEERRRPTRRTVARPEDTEFVAVKRTTKKVAPTLNYHTTSNSRKKSKPFDPAIISLLTKCAWIFAGFLVVRLVFAKGGVTDFYSQHKVLVQKQSELKHIKDENMQLVREIERMHTDAGYQKKLVRDNLGFIASDEYLILFPKE